MAGLKGLGKGAKPDAERRAEDFIAGAAVRVAAHGGQPPEPKPTKAKEARGYERQTFSLAPGDSATIDRLALVPRTFRATRSDVVRAGMAALERLPEVELVALLAEVKGRE